MKSNKTMINIVHKDVYWWHFIVAVDPKYLDDIQEMAGVSRITEFGLAHYCIQVDPRHIVDQVATQVEALVNWLATGEGQVP